MSLRIAIAGAGGRMGQALSAEAAAHADIAIAGATQRSGPGVAEAAANADVWIDFTTPAATSAALAALTGTPVRAAIIGTTGLDAAQQSVAAGAAQRIAVVQSGNFSLGVAVLARLVREAAARLGPDWDIEILETHHRNKVDAPSGTALMLGEAAAAGRGASLASVRGAVREGIAGPRSSGAINFAARRGGGIVGEHEAMFAGAHDLLRLSHTALDRSVFAAGAIAAARWAVQQPPGLYTLSDVLGP